MSSISVGFSPSGMEFVASLAVYRLARMVPGFNCGRLSPWPFESVTSICFVLVIGVLLMCVLVVV